MLDRKIFFPNDLDRINNKYFNKIRAEEIDFLDPSYWFENFSKIAIDSGFNNIKNYTSDYQEGLKREKPAFVKALSDWDVTEYDCNDITICSSATGASITLLAYFKNVFKIDKLYFETPCYFASLNQAEFLGYHVTMLPTYFPDFELDSARLVTTEPKIVWLTQPRFGLGKNYNLGLLRQILQTIGDKDFLVIDEAAESCFPSHLANYSFKYDQRIIKIRSPFKGVGINGPRVSMIIHGSRHSKQIQNTLQQVHGSMDVFSLKFAKEIFEKEDFHKHLLLGAKRQVEDACKKLRAVSIGTNLEVSNVEGGYIGSVSIIYRDKAMGYPRKRESLLKYCAQNRMPVILGSTMHFAIDENREYIRLSYFNRFQRLKEAIKVLAKFTV